MNPERKRKWKLYRDAIEWIGPHFESNSYSSDDFVEHFKVSKDEVTKLINKLINDNKLIKDEVSGLYRPIRLCSMCGKEFDRWDIQENNHIKHFFGYGSKYDLSVFEADLCNECYDKIVEMILPLFPVSPMRDVETYSEPPEYRLYAQTKYEHDNDPF